MCVLRTQPKSSAAVKALNRRAISPVSISVFVNIFTTEVKSIVLGFKEPGFPHYHFLTWTVSIS